MESPQTARSDSGDPTPARVDSAFVARVRAELAALDTATTLNDWRAIHPGDSVALFSHQLQDRTEEAWCARSTLSDTAGVTAFVRGAYFYPPTPPPELQLPTAPSEPGATCRLGAIWVESPVSGDVARDISAQDLIEGLRRWYGRETAIDLKQRFRARVYFNGVVMWHSGDVTVVAALDRRSLTSDYESPTLRAVAFARPSTLGYRTREHEFNVFVTPYWMSPLAERAIRLVRAGPAESAPLLQLVREGMVETTRDSAERMAWTARGMSVLRDWVTKARARGAAERAAALLAADIALSLPSVRFVLPNDSTARNELVALGAEFTYSSIGEVWVYGHSWRRTAQVLAPSGPVADLALLAQMEHGFDDEGMCSAGAEEFRRVIAEGEPFLSRLQERSDRTELHYLLGMAYADVVGLADGADEYAEPEKYREEAAAARARSIQHLREALSLDPRAPSARHAWMTAWRLQAGLPPLSVRFFCIYD
jgi:hypothetical protein